MSNDKQPYDGATLGEQIGGYRLLRRLGDGSTSTVFLGEHVRLGRHSAIKVLSSDFSEDAQTIQRLVNEARVVNDIRHPNIADISDIVEQDTPRRVALVMEYIKGPSLKTFRGNPLPATQALALALQLVDAVQAAHARGVIHRDIKPDNLLLAQDPGLPGETPLELKVVDFGIAKISGPESQSMTVSGTMLGTPAYMAPEQIVGSPAPSPATDVFAVGAVVYELVTGLRAYPSARLQDTVRAKLRGELPELKSLEIPGGDRLLAMIRTCLQRQPAARPQLEQLRASLERCLRQAAGESLTDALALPTLGLTTAGPVPAPAATELSGVPAGALDAFHRAHSKQEATDAPDLIAALHAQEPDDEDEVGTELAQSSLDDPGFGQFATEQASADQPPWMAGQKDVATAMAGSGIPEQGSVATHLAWDTLTEELSEEPQTSPGDLDLGGLLGPVGGSGALSTETVESAPVGPAEIATTKPPPALATTSTSNPVTPSSGSGLSPQDSLRPDRLFASGVGIGPGSGGDVEVPARLPEPSSALLRGFLVVVVILLLAACAVGAAVLGGFVDFESAPEPAPVEDTSAVPPPSVTPRT